jgi:dUTP pyrophosphatase
MESKSNTLKFSKVRNVKSPVYSTEGSAAFDLFVPEDLAKENTTLYEGEVLTIPMGIKVSLPKGYCLQLTSKSGLAKNCGVQVMAGLIDEDYQGEICAIITLSKKDCVFKLESGTKLVQAKIQKVPDIKLIEVPELNLYSEKTERGEGGMGSTGLK